LAEGGEDLRKLPPWICSKNRAKLPMNGSAAQAVMRALNRHVERVFNPDKERHHHWGKRKLKKDE
jgi:hypothetical protein